MRTGSQWRTGKEPLSASAEHTSYKKNMINRCIQVKKPGHSTCLRCMKEDKQKKAKMYWPKLAKKAHGTKGKCKSYRLHKVNHTLFT